MAEGSPMPLSHACMEWSFCHSELGHMKNASSLPFLGKKCSPRIKAGVNKTPSSYLFLPRIELCLTEL
jgi:hypothetical protein